MTPDRYQKILAVLHRRQPDLTVITDQVHKGQNLSAIIRTCDAVGIPRVHSIYEEGSFRAHTGTALGSHKWVETCVYRSIGQPVGLLQQQGFQVLAAHFCESAVDYRNVDYTKPTALLLGAEKWGVSEEATAQVDGNVIIPMLGMVESYNVSVACAIILAEAQRQRKEAGLYDHRRLPDKEYQQLLFEWCQPVVAKYCQRHGLAYPALNDEGDVAEPDQLKREVVS